MACSSQLSTTSFLNEPTFSSKTRTLDWKRAYSGGFSCPQTPSFCVFLEIPKIEEIPRAGDTQTFPKIFVPNWPPYSQGQI